MELTPCKKLFVIILVDIKMESELLSSIPEDELEFKLRDVHDNE